MNIYSRLYDLLDLSASETARADLDRLGCSIDDGPDRDKVGSELPLLGHADMLSDTTLSLGLTLTGNDLSGDCTLSANLTSSSHYYIHLAFALMFPWRPNRLLCTEFLRTP